MYASANGKSAHLVDDLVPIIVHHFAVGADSKAVAALALVSSAWLNPVRNALYGSLKLLSYHSCYLFSRTLGQSPTLGNRIHTLHLQPVSRHCTSGIKCNCRDVDAISLSLAPLFRLRHLSTTSLGGDCAIHAEWYLRSFVYSETIKSLRVEGMLWYWSFEINRPVAASLRWNEGLASRLSNLKNLEFVNLDLRICEPQGFKPSVPHLETLSMNRVRITSGKLSNLANNAWDTLRKLTLVVSEHNPEYDVGRILTQSSQNLSVFKYFVKDAERQDNLDSVIGVSTLTSCLSLRDLQLSLPFGNLTLQALGPQLNQLEVLKVCGNYEIDVEDWAVALSNGIFPNLREIYLPIGHELRRLSDWQWPALRVGTLRKVCEKRRISLTYVYLSD